MSELLDSELILNPDGSVYHLNLKPENISDTIIFVGDQDRVAKVAKHFETIEFDIQKREFRTITGNYKGKRLTILSTGIGPDNIDIVMNELDALVNIDLDKKTIKKELKSLNIVRIGTSGSLQKEIPIDSFVISKYGLGLDNMLHSYNTASIFETEIENAFIKKSQWDLTKGRPYIVQGNTPLVHKMSSKEVFEGFTVTAPGFYGPQGRVLRLNLQDAELNDKIQRFSFKGTSITNLEMETSAIYGLSKLLGHKAVSMNAIIANRATGAFSKNPGKIVESLIKYTLDKLV
jgi:uridine phosphorylase